MTRFLYIPFPDWLVKADRWLFELINVRGANPFLDGLLPLFRNPYVWGPLYLFVVAFVLINFKKQGWLWLLLFVCTAASTDLVGSHLFKHIFERLRPCNDPEMEGHVRMVLGRCSGGFSFVSNHAINHFGISMFFFVTFRRFFRYAWAPLVWAGIIGLSQVYVGVHYPFDVLGGTILGILIGLFWGNLFNKRIGFHIFDKESTEID
ncbi:phosphatase PAP2 family protein [Niabella drilacis]|uniref:Undecaprenyl-diphosphatase n=1 Tax=Niabella drilacis (strain DSM 25811 / CCM 8410 / CCUG 62505 / LMG 26954 / E90) TaxID=1285928 RepID=A0A1G6Z6N0_NIADE|nr:phosphatase PAP2 family protein [Niabella drilacis]SDD97525.1 undecaprenyl-diphosphatase [Niabella drilacis]